MSKSKVRKAEVSSVLEKKARTAVPACRHQVGSPTTRFFSDILSNAPTADLSEKMRDLVRLAKEQGYLTYNDISDALPENVTEPKPGATRIPFSP